LSSSIVERIKCFHKLLASQHVSLYKVRWKISKLICFFLQRFALYFNHSPTFS